MPLPRPSLHAATGVFFGRMISKPAVDMLLLRVQEPSLAGYLTRLHDGRNRAILHVPGGLVHLSSTGPLIEAEEQHDGFVRFGELQRVMRDYGPHNDIAPLFQPNVVDVAKVTELIRLATDDLAAQPALHIFDVLQSSAEHAAAGQPSVHAVLPVKEGEVAEV